MLKLTSVLRNTMRRHFRLAPNTAQSALLAAALAVTPAVARTQDAEPSSPVEVQVTREGDAFVVNASMKTPVSPREAWAVLTDFGRMAGFVPHVKKSTVLSRNGRTVRVSQEGQTEVGPFTLNFESVRDIELRPFDSIVSRGVSGSMAQFEGVTRLQRIREGTLITYRAVAVPGNWLPSSLGENVIGNDARERFEGFLAEMSRRRAPVPPTRGKQKSG